MEFLNVPTINGISRERVYKIEELPYMDILMNTPTCSKKTRKSLITYMNIPCAFDIETTSIETPKNHKGEYEKSPYGFMYHWQFCIDKYVVFGRTWEQFRLLIKYLCEKLQLTMNRRLVIYCHNLSFEFQFMKEFIGDFTLFARKARQPMKIECVNGIEFRCSYLLSNMSLQKFCENSIGVTHYKLDGVEFDYRKIRYPDTVLSELEKSYCYNDVRGLCECIACSLREDNIANIPLTSTGYVRRQYRRAVTKNPSNREKFLKSRLNEKQYLLLCDMFRGGNTHANRFFSNTILTNLGSRDEQSAYPACMMMDYFPIGKFNEVNIDNNKDLDYYCNNYCVIMRIIFKNVNCKEYIAFPYLDIAHCTKHINVVNDNGRILSADYIEYACTEIDLEIIREQYKFDGFVITESYIATRGKLPKEIRLTLIDLFRQKTTLKGVAGKEYEYLKSKNRVNSSFGMMVQKLINESNIYDPTLKEWRTEKEDISKGLDKYYDSKNSFLSYQHGVYVTAHARRRLNMAHKIVGLDGVYTDTDSCKYVNRELYEEEFRKLNEKIMYECEHNDIPAVIEHNGKKYYLGIFEYESDNEEEPVYSRFKTLGAKKYAYEDDKGFHITVAGMNKKKGAKVIGKLENFAIGNTFHDVGRTTSWYNEEEPHMINVNGHVFESASNIGILESTYTMGVTGEYWELIHVNPEFLEF